jgi:hypothetical protein
LLLSSNTMKMERKTSSAMSSLRKKLEELSQRQQATIKP